MGEPNQNGEAGHYYSVNEVFGSFLQPSYRALGVEIPSFESALEYIEEPGPGESVVVYIDNCEE